MMTSLVLDFEDRQGVVVDLDSWPGTAQMLADIRDALERACGPTGAWRRHRTFVSSVGGLKHWSRYTEQVLRRSASVSDTLGFAAISPAVWNEWRVECEASLAKITAYNYARCAKVLLDHSSSTSEPLKRHIQQIRVPRGTWSGDREVRDSYSPEDFELISRAASRTINQAYRRIKPSIDLLDSDPAALDADRVARRDALISVLRDGRPATDSEWQALGATRTGVWKRKNGFTERRAYGLVNVARSHLFLTPAEGIAAATVMVCRQGYNITTLLNQERPSNAMGAGAAADVFTLISDKARRGPRLRHFANVLADTGEDSDGWWVKRIRWITEPARARLRIVGVPDLPWIVWSSPAGQGDEFLRWGYDSLNMALVSAWWPLPDETLTFQKLHRTFQNRITRAPAHNRRDTHIRSYRMLDRSTREEARATTERGLERALAHAREQVRVTWLDETDPDDDTVLASCSDYDHHPDTGVRCVADFFSCLSCRNAAAAPRHTPRLVLAYDTLDGLRGSLRDDQFDRKFAVHWMRLHAVLGHFSKAEVARARASITETDRTVFRQLIDGTLQYEGGTP